MFEPQEILVIAVVVGIPLVLYLRLVVDRRREAFLRQYTFPHGLFDKVRETYPNLTAKEYHLATQALRQFFNAYRASKYRFVGMPSQVADEVWHNFILFTKDYEAFCRGAFGRFFHHVPASAYREGQLDQNANLRRTWLACCQQEGINPYAPSRLPLLFAIDSKFGIAGATVYTLTRPQIPDPVLTPAFTGTGPDVTSSGTPSNDFSVYNFIDSLVGDSSSDSGSDSGSSDSGSSCGGGCGGGGD